MNENETLPAKRRPMKMQNGQSLQAWIHGPEVTLPPGELGIRTIADSSATAPAAMSTLPVWPLVMTCGLMGMPTIARTHQACPLRNGGLRLGDRIL
jgi:hypothetical protein